MKQADLTLTTFQSRFQTDEAGRNHLFAMRWPNGFRCPECGQNQYIDISSRYLLQCKACRSQASLTAGTIFHKVRTSLRLWFWGIFFVAHDKRGISTLALSRELGVTVQNGLAYALQNPHLRMQAALNVKGATLSAFIRSNIDPVQRSSTTVSPPIKQWLRSVAC